MMWAWDNSGWGLFWMVLTMVVFWGALVAIIATVLRSPDRRGSGESSDALEILRRRFASGEIDEEEYRERLRALNVSP